MTDAAFVDQASEWARDLTNREARGPGDIANAWRRLEMRYGVTWRTFWALRYRKPAALTAYTFNLLRAAYLAECERQTRKLQHDIAITKAITGASHPAVDEAEALVGTDYAQDD